MKIKKYLAILLSSAMVLQMSVMAFANEDQPKDYQDDYGSTDSGYGVIGVVSEDSQGGGGGYAESGSGGIGSTDLGGGGSGYPDSGSGGIGYPDSESGGIGYPESGSGGIGYPDSGYDGSGSESGYIKEDFPIDGGDTGTAPGYTGGSGEQEYEDEKKQEEPSEPQKTVDEKKEPEQKQEEPSEPQKPVEAEKEPEQKQEEPSEPQEPVEAEKEPEQKQAEPSEPQEPSTPEPQVSIVSTAAGNALPTAALGNAITSTKSVSLDLYNIEPAQYVNFFTAVISSVPQNGQAVIALNKDSCLNRKIVEEIAARSDVTVNIIYKDKAGITKLIVIPAGANLSSLVDANGYIGFETLAAAFGEKVLQ